MDATAKHTIVISATKKNTIRIEVDTNCPSYPKNHTTPWCCAIRDA
jgi:hypothetical protein